MCGPNSLFFNKKLEVGGSIPIVWPRARAGGVYGESVSQPFLCISVWVFSCVPDV